MEKSELKAVVLFSGGFDSMVLAEYVVNCNIYSRITLLYFNYGNVNYIAEILRATKFVNYLKGKNSDLTIELVKFDFNAYDNFRVSRSTTLGGNSTGNEDKNEYVPMRNLLFLSTASAYAEQYGYRDVYFGTIDNLNHHYSDTSPLFVRNMDALVGGMTGGAIQIKAPFVHMNKVDLAYYVLDDIGAETLKFILDNAVTCNVTRESEPCGKCKSCKEYEEFKIFFLKLLKGILR